MPSPQKPLLLFCATPGDGHILPVLAIARALISRGYTALFTTSSSSSSLISAAGASFIPLSGRADFTMSQIHTLFPPSDGPPKGPYSLAHAMKYIFGSTISDQHATVQKILKDVQEKEPGRQVVMLHDATFWGTLPVLLGAEGIRPTGVINLGIAPLPLRGLGVPPFGMGLPYDASPEGVEKNEALYAGRDALFSELTDGLDEIFASLGVGPLKESIFDLQVTLPHRFLQMCIPSLEYPRPNPPPGLRFTGALPRGHGGVMEEKPSWWGDVSVNQSKKRVVFVSQGTATTEYQKLILPTLEGLAGCENVLVVAALGRKGATLPEGFEGPLLPKNARVGDFIPFDELLPYVDVFVTNGGYGGFQHAVSHGVPLIVAGMAADKPEVAARVEWAGLGINMRTEVPTPEAVREAVEKVLSDGRYKERAKSLEEEMGRYDVFEIVEESIKELCA